MQQCVLEALCAHRTPGAHPLRDLDADTVGREELCRVDAATAPFEHPTGIVLILDHGYLELRVPMGAWSQIVQGETLRIACRADDFLRVS